MCDCVKGVNVAFCFSSLQFDHKTYSNYDNTDIEKCIVHGMAHGGIVLE